MYEIDCPKCEKTIDDVESEDIPGRACDDAVLECPHCEHEFKFGWTTTLETR